MARPSAKASLPRPNYARRSARWTPFIAFGNSVRSYGMSTKVFAKHARLRMLSRQRKKNGRSHPAGSHARSSPTVAHHLQRSPQVRTSGSGGDRDGGALSHASGWGNGFDQTARIRN